MDGVVTVDVEQIGKALGRIPSGCAILTVQDGVRATGLLVSWIQQAGFDPPALTVCIKQGRPAIELIDASGRFVINVVGDPPQQMFKHFGKGFRLDQDAFDGVGMVPSPFGPVLSDCVAQLGCRVIEKVDLGDHCLYIAEVAEASATDAAPYVHVRKSGFGY